MGRGIWRPAAWCGLHRFKPDSNITIKNLFIAHVSWTVFCRILYYSCTCSYIQCSRLVWRLKYITLIVSDRSEEKWFLLEWSLAQLSLSESCQDTMNVFTKEFAHNSWRNVSFCSSIPQLQNKCNIFHRNFVTT